MQVELEDYENGKPITFKTTNDIALKIKEFKGKKQYDEMFALAQTMPNSRQKYLLEANALLHLKKWKELVVCCERGLDLEENSDFYNLLGKGKGKLGDHEAKRDVTQKAINLNPKVPAYHRNLGASYYKLKNYEAAIAEHEVAIKLQEKSSINYHNKGAALFRLDKFQQAKLCFQEAIKLDGKQVISHGWLGDSEKELKEYKRAKHHYQRAYELSSNSIYEKERDAMEDLMNPGKKKGIKGFFSKLFD